MVTLGPVSSLFDYATFFTMLFVFNAWTNEALFQTAWFIESLCSQTLVVLVIRTRRVPFYKSKPSKYLTVMLLSVITFAIIVPFTPLGDFFGFVPPPPAFFLALAGILGAYAVLAEAVKRWFYGRNAHRLEQVLVPKRRSFVLSRSAKVMQYVIAVINLRPEDEIWIDSLVEDVSSASSYPLDPNEVIRDLYHLRRSGLISEDFHRRTIKREESFKTYVEQNVKKSEIWPEVAADWKRIGDLVQARSGGAKE